MSRELVSHNKPVFDELHPRVYGTAVGLVAWFVLSAWVLFDRGGEVALSLGFVTMLLLVAVVLPWALSEIWRKYRMSYEAHPQKPSFHDWKSGSFSVWGASLHGSHATLDVLLPLAAVAFGLTAIGIVFVIVNATT
jgi:hypothetical protein